MRGTAPPERPGRAVLRHAAVAVVWIGALVALVALAALVHGSSTHEADGALVLTAPPLRGPWLMAVVLVPSLVAGEVDGWLGPTGPARARTARDHVLHAILGAFLVTAVITVLLVAWLLVGLGESMGTFVVLAAVVVAAIRRPIAEGLARPPDEAD